jgi:hypothetical protein
MYRRASNRCNRAPPLEIWSLPTTAIRRSSPGRRARTSFRRRLGGFFSLRDLRELDRQLRARSTGSDDSRRGYEADCTAATHGHVVALHVP